MHRSRESEMDVSSLDICFFFRKPPVEHTHALVAAGVVHTPEIGLEFLVVVDILSEHALPEHLQVEVFVSKFYIETERKIRNRVEDPGLVFVGYLTVIVEIPVSHSAHTGIGLSGRCHFRRILEYAVPHITLNNRLYGTWDTYIKDVKDMLIRPAYLGSMGEGGASWVNGPSLRNWGMEFLVGWRDDLACGFSYKASLNFDFFRSKVTYLPATATGSYADGEWHFLGACEPDERLDTGWFIEPASRAMLLHSRWFGKDRPEDAQVGPKGMAVVLNHLDRYADTTKLWVKAVDEDGRPVPGAVLDFKVANHGELGSVQRGIDLPGRNPYAAQSRNSKGGLFPTASQHIVKQCQRPLGTPVRGPVSGLP